MKTGSEIQAKAAQHKAQDRQNGGRQYAGKFWVMLAVTLMFLTLACKMADAQTIDSAGRCHDSSGKYAAKSVCAADNGAETGSTNPDDYKPSSKASSSKIQAEDGTYVNADFYSKTDYNPAPSSALTTKGDQGYGYFLYAYEPATGEMGCTWSMSKDRIQEWKADAESKGWDIVKVYWATADSRSYDKSCKKGSA